MNRRRRWVAWLVSAGCLAVLSALGALTAQAVPIGKLTQLAGLNGCMSEDGFGGLCADGKALLTPKGVAVSPDGKNLYVASEDSDAVATFRRNTTSGFLTQLSGTNGCVSEDGSLGLCVDGKALDGPTGVAVSADGKNVYVASRRSDAIAVFKRNLTTGQLTQLAGTNGCISDTGSAGLCLDGRALNAAQSVALSADGNSLYVASDSSDAVAAFKRNTTSGALTQIAGTNGCISEDGSAGLCVDGKALSSPSAVAITADGKNVYVTSSASSAVAAFKRNTTTAPVGKLTQLASTNGCVSEDGTAGTCANGKALISPASIAVSPDNKHAYVASVGSDAVAAFTRDATTGKLTQLAGTAGCVSEDGTAGTCANGKALSIPVPVSVSPDGTSVYVGSNFFNAVSVFARNTTSGQLTQLAATNGCVSEDGTAGTCANGKALEGPASIALSADSKSLYSASSISNAVAALKRNTTP